MSSVFNSIMAGLDEAIDDARKIKKLSRRTVMITPVKNYTAQEVKAIRHETGMSQKLFAEYLGVSQSQIYKLTMNMEIPHYKPQGKTIYFDKKELLKWMRNNHITPARKDSANK